MDEKTHQYKMHEIVTFDGRDSGNNGYFWQIRHIGYNTYTDPSGPFQNRKLALDDAKANIDLGNC